MAHHLNVYHYKIEADTTHQQRNRNLFLNSLCRNSTEIVSPQSLKQTCVDFIIHNFGLVDCLKGLPVIVAKELFDSYIIKKPCLCSVKFSDSVDRWQRDMAVFVSSHKQNVLKSIDLSGNWLFLSLQIEHVFSFLYLEELDISSCRVGDHHEVLFFIGKLELLKKLSLNNNNLTSEGVKNLTQYQRRAKKGLSKLEYLRLEQNKIENIALVYLQCLPLLSVIVVDNEKLKHACVRHLFFSYCLSPNDHDFDILCDKICVNEGWAVSLLENCIKKVSERNCAMPSSKNFYKKKRIAVKSFSSVSDPCSKFCGSFILCSNSIHHSHKHKHTFAFNCCNKTKKLNTDTSNDPLKFKEMESLAISNGSSTSLSAENYCLKLDASILEIYGSS